MSHFASVRSLRIAYLWKKMVTIKPIFKASNESLGNVITIFTFLIITKFKTDRYLQFGTQVRFCWSCDRNNRTAENAFSAPWYFSEMEFEPAAG